MTRALAAMPRHGPKLKPKRPNGAGSFTLGPAPQAARSGSLACVREIHLWRAKEVSPLGRGVPLCFSCQELRGADAFEPPRIALVLSDLRVPLFEQGVVGLVHEHGVGLCGID